MIHVRKNRLRGGNCSKNEILNSSTPHQYWTVTQFHSHVTLRMPTVSRHDFHSLRSEHHRKASIHARFEFDA